MDGNMQHEKRSAETALQHEKGSAETAPRTTQKSQICHHFWYLFELLGPPWEDLGAKGIPSGFQRPLLDDFWRILVPIGDHFWTLLEPRLAKRLLRDAFTEVLGQALKKTSRSIEFLILSNPLD